MNFHPNYRDADALISGCTPGVGQPHLGSTSDNLSDYSSAALTYAAAGLEQLTGRTIRELIHEKFTRDARLSTLAVSFAAATPPEEYDRAVLYLSDLERRGNCTNNAVDRFCVYDLPNNSWKVLGGGLEISTVDLARFGELVRRRRLVSDIDDLWTDPGFVPPTPSDPGTPGTGFGIGWTVGGLTRDASGAIIDGFVDHGGDWEGTSPSATGASSPRTSRTHWFPEPRFRS